MKPSQVIIAVEGGSPTGGAERIAFDTVKVLSEAKIPVVIISSAAKVDDAYRSLPGVTVEALNLPLQFERFFDGGKKHMILNLTQDRTMKPLFSNLLQKHNKPGTVYHGHGFHNYFTQASFQVAIQLKMVTILTCHDFGLTCPNGTLFNYQTHEICPLKPLSLACLKSECMGSKAVRLKQLRFARTWASAADARKLDAILSVSDFERDILTKHGLPHVETLHNPVDPASTEIQNPKESKHFLWVGRMTDEKDAITPAKTCQDLGLPITFVGDGPLRADVEAANPEAIFLGWQKPDDVKKAQCAARAMILSSKWHETASLVVLECLAAGIPCIVPDTSAAVSWVEDGVNGIYFKAGDQGSLANALQQLQDDRTVERMSQAAYERYWKNPFTLERYKTDLLAIYSEALSRREEPI